MYNDEQKRRYIEINSAAEPWFRLTEEFEKDNGKDIYDFTTPQILDMYRLFVTTSLERLILANSVFTRYAEWALKNTLVRDGQNHFAELTPTILNTCIDKNGNDLITRDELRKLVSRLQNPLDKYVFWALFDGLKGHDFREVTNLKWDDIDKENNTARLCTGRTVHVSNELIDAASQSKDEDIYYVYSNPDADPGDTKKPIAPERKMVGDVWKVSVKKNIADSDKSRGRQCYEIVIRCARYLGRTKGYFSTKYLWDSGIMEYIYKLADEYGIKPVDVLYDHVDELHAQYGFTKQMRSNFKIKYGKYFE